ncbi:preprotein translocase subunit YajC [Fusobacterium perfoetens]|uniref:preprotein translocase subunit YajC n=1 Tax=Fusobacterium perfoetens TaxID=852 RepID=UPI000482CE61|nr:preprotein translocase subunit YajC [Fusobacterium perfoetens]MCI6151903.1 preprotein translocase subunit YajC [Fusobacterium perfoetens]MDY3238243.1 preprotein translocase subunit YajC [Fusobacterium perfoetens]
MKEIFAKYGTLIMIALWIVIIYVFMVLPNKKKQKKQQQMLDNLKAGDTIVTVGGIKGVISSVEEAFVVIRIDKGVHMTIRKSAVAGILE